MTNVKDILNFDEYYNAEYRSNCELTIDTLYLALSIGRAFHYSDVIMGAVPSQITSLAIVYSTVYTVADQRKHQSSASLAFVRGIHRWPVNSPHKWPVARKMFPFDDVTIWVSSMSILEKTDVITAPHSNQSVNWYCTNVCAGKGKSPSKCIFAIKMPQLSFLWKFVKCQEMIARIS